MALAIAELKNASSPFPSEVLPQRGSLVKSTIGEKVHIIPSALASLAAIRADLSIKGMSQVEDIPMGIGKIVL